MQVRLIAIAAAAALSLAAHDALAYDYTAPVPPHTVAGFDPSHGVIPFPNNLLLQGTTDLTLNIPVDPSAADAGPKLAMNALDGFSTTAPWSMTFSAPISAASIAGSVHMYEVTLSGPGGGVTGVVRELASPQEFVATLAPSDTTGATLAIVPTAPLKERTSYLAVVTNGIKDAGGAPVRGSFTYLLATGHNALCTGGKSNVRFLPDASACQLEPLRQLVNTQEAAAYSKGIAPGSIAMSWTATTQSITPTLKALSAITQASPKATTHVAPTGKTLGDLGVGLPPIADIYIGTISLPYYLASPQETCFATDPNCSPLVAHWNAAPGAYIPQCAAFGLDPTSTNLTACNPVPVTRSTQVVPLLLTLPNAASGKTMPAAGWPLVIFQHGITRNRTDMFAIAGTLAAQGYAVVAIDLPLHGLVDKTNPFYAGNTPFVALGAHERTFDLDVQSNTTGAPGADGKIDSSGSHYINLTSLLTSRDNLRQGVADVMQLAHAASSLPNVDASHTRFVGQSLGSIVGTMVMAVDPTIKAAVLNVPGGGIARLLDASPAFGPSIHAGLAAAGLVQGTPSYDAYFVATQTVIDSGDPINYAGNGTLVDPAVRSNDSFKNILINEVVGGGDVLPDQVIPNRVTGAPLSGTEPLIAALGAQGIDKTVMLSNQGLQVVTRFLQGEHGSLLDPTDFPYATMEMQGEMASFVAYNGFGVLVNNPTILKSMH
jgi:pimeloyl-ACP methyl ester carboxylesterase